MKLLLQHAKLGLLSPLCHLTWKPVISIGRSLENLPGSHLGKVIKVRPSTRRHSSRRSGWSYRCVLRSVEWWRVRNWTGVLRWRRIDPAGNIVVERPVALLGELRRAPYIWSLRRPIIMSVYRGWLKTSLTYDLPPWTFLHGYFCSTTNILKCYPLERGGGQHLPSKVEKKLSLQLIVSCPT